MHSYKDFFGILITFFAVVGFFTCVQFVRNQIARNRERDENPKKDLTG
jgi:hypothetical protein